MTPGDSNDILARLKAVLPARWFGDDTPVLDGVLTGLASAWSWVHELIDYARIQARIGTAGGAFLDMIAVDFFGTWLQRRASEGDTAFRARIGAEMLRPRGTRPALVSALEDLTGRTPAIFEPSNPSDTGGYNLGGLGYGGASSGGLGSEGLGSGGLGNSGGGGYGSLALPFQAFVTAYRPTGAGIAGIAGYGGAGGGYGAGGVEYTSPDMIAGTVTDAEIYATIAHTLPVATTAWTAIA